MPQSFAHVLLYALLAAVLIPVAAWVVASLVFGALDAALKSGRGRR